MDELKAAYDREESPNLEEYEPNTVASLLKQYLRDLPENLLTKELTPRFEEACGRSSEGEKVQELQRLLWELPECNQLLISWLIVHMDHVISKELETKMNIQNISIVLSPTVQVHGLSALKLCTRALWASPGVSGTRPVAEPHRAVNQRLSLDVGLFLLQCGQC